MSELTVPIVWTAGLFDRTGYGEEARSYVLGLDRAGLRVLANPNHWTPWQKQLRGEDAERLEQLVMVERPPRFVHVMHMFATAFHRHPAAIWHVGRTMWETDGLLPAWVARCNEMDEVWVPSHFNVETFARAGVAREKLHVVPECLQLELFDPTAVEPLLPAEAHGFVFLSMFVWHLRKGWDVLVRAYVEEFAPDEDVTLLLKAQPLLKPFATITAELRSFLVTELGRDPRSTPRIVLLDSNPGALGIPRLYRAANAYVQPSRGEGWGRPFMEAMAMGLPTIATRWSGNLEFMNDDNSFLIDCELREVSEAGAREWPGFRGQRWAEPSVPHLRRLLRRVYEEREMALAKGAKARDDIRRLCGMDRVIGIIEARLQAFTASHLSPTHGQAPAGFGTAAGPSTPHVSAVVVAIHEPGKLARTLESLDAAFDEIVVAHRGLERQDRDSVRRFSAREVRVRAKDDEAAVRNAALADAGGTWALVLECGETLDPTSVADVRRLAAGDERGYYARVLAPARYDVVDPASELRLFPRTVVRFVGDAPARAASAASVPLSTSAVVIWREGLGPRPSTAELGRIAALAQREPADAARAHLLGRACVALERSADAERYLLAAMRAYSELPGTPSVLNELANCYMALAALMQRQARWAEHAGYAYAAIQLVPDLPEAYEVLARGVERLGFVIVASRAYEAAIACEERLGSGSRAATGRALLAMGNILLRRGRFADARDVLERAQVLRPDEPAVHAALAHAYWRLQQRDSATRELTVALAGMRVPAEAWLVLAEAYRSSARLSDAEATLVTALADSPHDERYRRALERVRGRGA